MARIALARAWVEQDFARHVGAALRHVVPELYTCFAFWQRNDKPNLVGDLAEPGARTPWVSAGLAGHHRPYQLDGPDPLGNRLLAGRSLSHIFTAPVYGLFREAFLAPQGCGPYLRATLDLGRCVTALFYGCRPDDGREFTQTERARLQALVPDLARDLTLRRSFDALPLGPGGLAAVADAIKAPVYVLGGKTVVYANAPARFSFAESPAWLQRVTERAPPGVQVVPLVFGDQAFHLVIADLLGVDIEDAPTAPWARRLRLEPRHAQVAAALLSGLSDKEIAARLGLEHSTIRTYVKRLYRRVGVHSRTELAKALLSTTKV